MSTFVLIWPWNVPFIKHIIFAALQVLAGGFAYINEKTTFELLMSSHCQIQLMKETFLPLPYGIAMQYGSAYKSILSHEWVFYYGCCYVSCLMGINHFCVLYNRQCILLVKRIIVYVSSCIVWCKDQVLETMHFLTTMSI